MRDMRFGGALLQGSAPLLVPMLFLLGACSGDSGRNTDGFDAAAYVAAGNVIDSIFPMEEEIRRYRLGMTELTELGGGAASVDDLVETFLRAVERADTSTVLSLGITREEFAWFYFPNSMYASAPYELPPGLVWMQMENATSQGLRKLIGLRGGQTLYDIGYRCPDSGMTDSGTVVIRDNCLVLGRLPDGTEVEESLFGSILEVGGRYKFVSFANGL